MAWGKKLLLSLSVFAIMLLKRLPDGSEMKKWLPLGEGSNTSSTDSELWGAENSSFRMRGNSDAPKGAACS